MFSGTKIKLAITLALFCCNILCDAQSDYRMVGYIMGSRLDTTNNEIDLRYLTHINYAFADVVEGKVVEIDERDRGNFIFLNRQKKRFPNLKILFSIGGWTRSGGFSDAVLTAASREVFANSAIAYMKRHHLDGIDIDWEYPGQIGNGNTFRPEDRENFTAALLLLRQKLDSLTKATGKTYLLTIASAASQRYLDHVEMNSIAQILDFINIMTYDYFGAWSNNVGNHAQLYPNGDRAVKQHLEAGVPSNKLVLGVAFYGRGWKQVDSIGAIASPKNLSANYHSILDSIELADYEPHWDSTTFSPWIWNESKSTLIGYDNERSLRYKAEYVKENKLGGIMFWEFHGDAQSRLQRTLHATLNTIPGHAHNDYEGKEPLHEALRLGFQSIEVDVHFIKDELYVSHNRPLQLDPEKTLENMYLKPLSQMVFAQKPLYLLIDVKTDAQLTFAKLQEVLNHYQNPSIVYVISGNRAIKEIVEQGGALMCLDGRKELIESGYSSQEMPFISDHYKSFFSNRDIDKIDPQEILSFRSFLEEAHQKGYLVRLWATPDKPEMWTFLQSLGVDLINTDKLGALADHLRTH